MLWCEIKSRTLGVAVVVAAWKSTETTGRHRQVCCTSTRALRPRTTLARYTHAPYVLELEVIDSYTYCVFLLLGFRSCEKVCRVWKYDVCNWSCTGLGTRYLLSKVWYVGSSIEKVCEKRSNCVFFLQLTAKERREGAISRSGHRTVRVAWRVVSDSGREWGVLGASPTLWTISNARGIWRKWNAAMLDLVQVNRMHRMMNVVVHHWGLNWPQDTGRDASIVYTFLAKKLISLPKSSMVTSCFPRTESCEWHTVETGECVPNCGGGQKREYYVITQRPANGGEDCPPFVYRNDSVKDCCRE